MTHGWSLTHRCHLRWPEPVWPPTPGALPPSRCWSAWAGGRPNWRQERAAPLPRNKRGDRLKYWTLEHILSAFLCLGLSVSLSLSLHSPLSNSIIQNTLTWPIGLLPPGTVAKIFGVKVDPSVACSIKMLGGGVESLVGAPPTPSRERGGEEVCGGLVRGLLLEFTMAPPPR